jgi:hypothetical protein
MEFFHKIPIPPCSVVLGVEGGDVSKWVKPSFGWDTRVKVDHEDKYALPSHCN